MSYFETFAFGITLAISIGPIAILILNQSINCGLKNGVLCGVGAAIADFSYALIAFTAGSFIFPLLNEKEEIIPILSSIILILFSIWMIYSTFKNRSAENEKKYSLTCKWPFFTTFGLTMTNPLTIIVFMGFSGLMTEDNSGNIFLHALVIFIASLSIQLLIAIIGSKLSHFFSKANTLLYFNLVSALAIMFLGISKLF